MTFRKIYHLCKAGHFSPPRGQCFAGRKSARSSKTSIARSRRRRRASTDFAELNHTMNCRRCPSMSPSNAFHALRCGLLQAHAEIGRDRQTSRSAIYPKLYPDHITHVRASRLAERCVDLHSITPSACRDEGRLALLPFTTATTGIYLWFGRSWGLRSFFAGSHAQIPSPALVPHSSGTSTCRIIQIL